MAELWLNGSEQRVAMETPLTLVIAARIADELFDDLDAPVKRVAATDTFVAYQPQLENVILPQPEDLFHAIEGLSKF